MNAKTPDRAGELTLDTAFGLRYWRTADAWSATMEVGPWTADEERRTHFGPLAVLMDIGLAMPLFFVRTDPKVSPVTVTLDIAFPPNVVPIGVLRTEGWVVGSDAAGGVISARILDEAGAPLAIGTMVGSFGRLPEDWDGYKEPSSEEFDASLTLTQILGGEPRLTDTGAEHTVRVEPWLANPRSGLHGGVAAALTDFVAIRALPGGPDSWRPAALRVDYLASAPLGSTLVIRAERVRHGSSFAVTRVDATSSEDRNVFTALVSYRRA